MYIEFGDTLQIPDDKLKKGDILICKKNYYKNFSLYNFLKSPIFRKGFSYKIYNVEEKFYGMNDMIYSNFYTFYDCISSISIFDINKYFFTEKEARIYKLKKLKKYKWFK